MKGSQASAEQRREGRDALLAGQLLIVELISDSPVFKTHGIVLNLSKGGMAVQTFRPLGAGRVVEIQLSLPRFSASAGRGLVEWQKPGGVAGIRFLPPLKTLGELRQWVQRYPSPVSASALSLSACRSSSSTNEFDAALHLFACSAMVLTGGTGAAIALGNPGGMECRASVGSAPEVGARLLPESGISGHSLRTGTVILCNDLQSDSRTNLAAARQLDIRSIVIIPIATAEGIVGLMEVFSQETDHFDEHHVQQLQPLMNVLAEAAREETSNGTGQEPDQEVSAILAAGTVEAQEVAPAAFAAHLKTPHRSKRAIAIGVAALLLMLLALWFSSRSRFSGNGTSPGRAQQNARPAQTGGAGAVSSAKATMSFSPPVVSQKVGAAFEVNVELQGARELSSVPVQILYDPHKLRVVAVASGDMLDHDGQASALVQRVDSAAGRINASISRSSSSPGVSGSGVVFTLSLVGKAAGRSTLRIDQTGLRDSSGKIEPVESSEAVITISGSTSPAARGAATNFKP